MHWITFTNIAFSRYRSPYRDQIELYAGTQQAFCEAVLREVVKRAEPRAVELSFEHDYFIAGVFGLQTETVQTCKLPASSGTLPVPSPSTQ